MPDNPLVVEGSIILLKSENYDSFHYTEDITKSVVEVIKDQDFADDSNIDVNIDDTTISVLQSKYKNIVIISRLYNI